MNPLRTATTPPADNRWKVLDDTGDEFLEGPEDPAYFDSEPDAYEAYEKILAEGGNARLYSCYDDGDDMAPWELQEFTGNDLADPRNVPCAGCGATNRYLFPSGECTDCYPRQAA